MRRLRFARKPSRKPSRRLAARRAQAVVLSSWAQAASQRRRRGCGARVPGAREARDPGNVKAAHALARLEELRGDDTAAEALYREILRLRPGEAHASVSLARLLAETRGDVGGARDAFVAAARANPENHKVLQSWAVMEAKQGGFPAKGVDSVDGVLTKSVDVGKKRGDTDLADLDVDALAGLAAARRLFQRAAFLAPWSAPVWCAWAAAEVRATGDCATARELYAKGLDADPTNTWCLRGLGEAELAAGRVAQARDYPSARWTSSPATGGADGARAVGGRERECARRRGTSTSRASPEGAEARGGGLDRERARRSARRVQGVWAPAEAAAAARGVAALNAAEGACTPSRRRGRRSRRREVRVPRRAGGGARRGRRRESQGQGRARGGRAEARGGAGATATPPPRRRRARAGAGARRPGPRRRHRLFPGRYRELAGRRHRLFPGFHRELAGRRRARGGDRAPTRKERRVGAGHGRRV